MADWTDHELETARLLIREAAQREQNALFASQTPLESLSPADRENHLALARELALDLEATSTTESWAAGVDDAEAPARWAETLHAVREG